MSKIDKDFVIESLKLAQMICCISYEIENEYHGI